METFWTVKQVAAMAGVSVRTLHYYDEIGLLRPRRGAANGYRLYSRESLLRLQQILFYRELGFPLQKIRALLDAPDFDPLQALDAHRQALLQQRERLDALLQTIDQTRAYLSGGMEMSPNQLFGAWSEEEERDYARQAEERYDPETVRASMRRWESYSPEEKERIKAEGNQIYADLAAAMPQGPASPAVQVIIARWHQHLRYFWSPAPEQLIGLAQMYGASPDFRQKFDALHPDLAEFMLAAVRHYVQSLAGSDS